MKKFTLSSVLASLFFVAAFSFSSQAQVRVDLGVGYAFGDAVGIVGYLEPKFTGISDRINVGLRLEAAGLISVETDVTSGKGSAAGITSYVATSDFYFLTGPVRPFVGAGAGVFSLAAASVSAGTGGTTTNEEAYTTVGFVPRAGIELTRFRLGVEYNIITGQQNPDVFNRNYFSLKLGAFFGSK